MFACDEDKDNCVSFIFIKMWAIKNKIPWVCVDME